MKILFHHRIASRDGQAVHMEELIEAFRRLGHEVIVAGPNLVDEDAIGGESRLVARLKSTLPKFAYELLEFLYSFVALRRLKRAHDQHRPDVLYERYNLFTLAGVWLKRLTGIPMFLEVNAPLFEERRRYNGLALARLARWTERATWKGADYVLPVTRVLARGIEAAGVPEERLVVVPNGINRDRFPRHADDQAEVQGVKDRFGLHGKIILGFSGFIREWHGLGMVVDLLADNRGMPLCLLLIGDGPGRPILESHARSRGVLDQVHFVGFVGRDEVRPHTAAFDIALQPAVTPYASPLKLFEYLALGKPVVAPKTPNIEEILVDEETALLFAPEDQQAFAAQALRLSRDQQLREKIGAAGRRLIEERDLTWDGNARRLTALFENAVNRRAAELVIRESS